MDGPTFHLSGVDAVDWLRSLPSESIDLVVTDPPYESLEKHRAIGTTTRLKHSKASSNDWFSIFPNTRFPELFAEVYRVLRRNSHFYLYCDPETMFVAKPLGEAAGFKFWKPIIWDKCLAPDTLVWTERGTIRIGDVVAGDRVAIPEGGTSVVLATRRVSAPSLQLGLSDGTTLTAARDHRLVRADGTFATADSMLPGDPLLTRAVRGPRLAELRLQDVIPEDDVICELWYPERIALDYELGKVIGLYAAEGSRAAGGVSFALHANEEHLHAYIARFARSLGIRAQLSVDDNKATVAVAAKLMGYLVNHFVGGEGSTSKYFRSSVFGAPADFRRGVLDGLLEGDGHWSHDEQRETYVSTSADLASFVVRELRQLGRVPSMQRFENEHAGGWRVRFDPIRRDEPLRVISTEDAGMRELVDISIADREELFLLANGVVTHNCRIGMGYHYRARYECILFFEKGKRKLNDLGIADILEAPRVSGGYPAEKPPKVSEILIGQSTEPGQLVIDPFMGSGSVGVAAATLGRPFRGNDLCKEAVDIARARLLDLGAREDTGPLVASTPGADAGPGGSQLGLRV